MTQPTLAKTKAQLEVLGWPFIGIQLKDGSKYFGRVSKFTPHKIYFIDHNRDELDVPRRIIERALLLIDGGKTDGGATAIRKAHRPEGQEG
jgi:hypothetical protein